VGIVDRTRPLRDGAAALARLLPKVDRGRTAIVVGIAFVVAGAQVGVGVVTGLLIGRVAEGRPIEGTTVALVVALPMVLLAAEAGRLIGATVGQTLKRRVDLSLRRRVLALSLEPTGIAHLEDPQLQALQGAARNLSPFSFTPGDAAVELTTGLSVRIQPVLAAAVIAWFEPVLAVICLMVWAVAHLLFIDVTVRLVLGAASTMSSPDIVYLREVVQGPAAAKEVRVFGLGGWLGGRFLSLTRERMARSLAQRTGDVRSYLRAGGVLGLGLFGGLAWVGIASTRSEMSPTAAAVCVIALLGLFSTPNLFPDVPVMFGTFSVGAVEAAERAVRDVMGGTATAAGSSAPTVEHGIHFRDVTFRYPGTDRPVVAHLDLDIPAGQRLAVVGLNGAGKTTLVKLLCRLYDPDEGCVEVDGVDLRSVDPADWRRCTAVVFQDFIRWHLPAHDNVELRGAASPAAGDADVAAQAAAERAGLDVILQQLPRGWDTPLHPAARGGVDLSGGQWQRVALARGLLAVEHGASVLVLDEPTANLDPRSEFEFYDAVLRRPLSTSRPITTILISHRFATVRHADRIVVLEDGRVIEDGTHDELVAAGGRYHDLFEIQARTYAEATDG
jgi:ABC-type multidrug transport system fused ATPase/permease subunit